MGRDVSPRRTLRARLWNPRAAAWAIVTAEPIDTGRTQQSDYLADTIVVDAEPPDRGHARGNISGTPGKDVYAHVFTSVDVLTGAAVRRLYQDVPGVEWPKPR